MSKYERGNIALNDAASKAGRRHPADDTFATDILGETGLFIADLRFHEPEANLDGALSPFVACACGWNANGRLPASLYFDHIGGPT